MYLHWVKILTVHDGKVSAAPVKSKHLFKKFISMNIYYISFLHTAQESGRDSKTQKVVCLAACEKIIAGKRPLSRHSSNPLPAPSQ